MLRERLMENRLIVSDSTAGDSVIFVSDSIETIQRFEYIPGRVINSTHDKRNNYFTLDIGSLHGVKRGMGVISDKGIVGVIHNTSNHFSVVKSCLTKDINTDIMIASLKEPGILKWDGRDARRGTMTGVSNDTKINKWSTVVTRGGAGIFPRGIPVGKVEKTEVVEGHPLWNITLLFAENYRSVQYVYVIKNNLLREQRTLEGDVPEEPLEE